MLLPILQLHSASSGADYLLQPLFFAWAPADLLQPSCLTPSLCLSHQQLKHSLPGKQLAMPAWEPGRRSSPLLSILQFQFLPLMHSPVAELLQRPDFPLFLHPMADPALWTLSDLCPSSHHHTFLSAPQYLETSSTWVPQ